MRKKSSKALIAVSALACALCLFGLFWALGEYMTGAPAAAPALATKADVRAGAAGATTSPISGSSPTEGAVQSGEAGAAIPATSSSAAGVRTIVALGESLTRGDGAPEGKGYAGYAADEVESRTGRKVMLTNLGEDGLLPNWPPC